MLALEASCLPVCLSGSQRPANKQGVTRSGLPRCSRSQLQKPFLAAGVLRRKALPRQSQPVRASPAVAFGENLAETLLSPEATAVTLALSFLSLRTAVYYRLQYITAAMLGRHVPRGGAKVLDLGPSGGTNFYYLPADVAQAYAVVAQGSNADILKNQALQAGVEAIMLEKPQSYVGLPTSSVDAVISIHCLCRIEDQQLKPVLLEALRVLKPGGRLIFLENVGSANGALSFFQGIAEALSKLINKPEFKTRDYLSLLKSIPGFGEIQSDMILEFQDPHVVGIAMKPMTSVVPEKAASTKARSQASSRRK